MNEALDINTERGQEAARLQVEALDIMRRYHPDLVVLHTPLDGPAACDCLLGNVAGELLAVAEVKSRLDMTLKELQRARNNEWLVTAAKIHDLRRLASQLDVPGFGILFIVPDRLVLRVTICDETGTLTVPIRFERTETQRTINGQRAFRLTAFINMSNAVRYWAEPARKNC